MNKKTKVELLAEALNSALYEAGNTNRSYESQERFHITARHIASEIVKLSK